MTDIDKIVFDKQMESLDWNIRDDLKGLSLENIIKQQPKNGFAVAVVNTDKGLNVGTIMRTAVLYGADEFIIIGNRKYDKRSTVGAQNYINVTKLDLESGIKYIDDRYFKILFDTGFSNFDDDEIRRIIMWKTLNYSYRPCFIFGNEKDGIPPEFNTKYAHKFSIPQYGVLRSFNVSVAAAIVMDRYVNVLMKDYQ